MEETKNISYECNKGTGAGGSNTNLYGKKFEYKTNNESRLLSNGFFKYKIDIPFGRTKSDNKNYYLKKQYTDKVVVFVLQHGLKSYMKNKFNIDLFRCPDEAYIIEYNTGEKVVKILEKKEQRVEGSVETKFWSCPSLKEEYEIVLGPEFKVSYGLCVNNFLKNKFTSECKKWVILNMILKKHNIDVMFGSDSDYFNHLDKWLDLSEKTIEVKAEEVPFPQEVKAEEEVPFPQEVKAEEVPFPQEVIKAEEEVLFPQEVNKKEKKLRKVLVTLSSTGLDVNFVDVGKQVKPSPKTQEVETEEKNQVKNIPLSGNICEEYTKKGLRCTSKFKLIRNDGKKVCGRHRTQVL